MTNTTPHENPMPAPPRAAVQRQIRLPLRTAVEIAYKNVRMRLSRSLLVTSGIVLAIAFLMSIQTSDILTNAMRTWMSGADKAYGAQQQTLKDSLSPVVTRLANAVHAKPPVAADEARAALQTELKIDLLKSEKAFPEPLPAPAPDLVNALVADPALRSAMNQWMDGERKLKDIQEKSKDPQALARLMTANGLATTGEAVHAARTQTHWVLALALLVAFVGILNAMLMSVTERFREIGTMKCLGALDSLIVKLFVIESGFQGIVGTLIGIFVGLGLSLCSIYWVYGEYLWRAFPGSQLFQAVAICFGAGVLLTVGGAVYPAWQAARMEPIEAMRVDT